MGIWFSYLMAKKPKMEFEDMDDDCLMQVLEQLSPANLMKMARVDRRLNRLVKVKLAVKIKKVFVESKWKGIPCCRHRSFASDETVYLDTIFVQKKMNTEDEKEEEEGIKIDFHSAPAKAKFLKTLALFASIKSIDFGVQELTNEVLQEVAKLCFEVECITVKNSAVDKSVWKDFFTQVGHQIVHFKSLIDEGTIHNFQQKSVLPCVLEMIVLMCPNIKQVDFYFAVLTNDIIALLKQLPQDCFVGVIAFIVNQPLDDSIDFLFCYTLDWLSFKNSSNHRLSELFFGVLINQEEPDFVVNFSNLKKLSWHSVRMFAEPEIGFLLASRYEKLESFEFKATIDLNEQDYKNLFENMPEVKQLDIKYFFVQFTNDFSEESALPGDAVLQLKKLERIQVTVNIQAHDWPSENFFQRLNWYVDEIPSLKSLVVKGYPMDIAEELEQLKERQNRVEIVVMFM